MQKVGSSSRGRGGVVSGDEGEVGVGGDREVEGAGLVRRVGGGRDGVDPGVALSLEGEVWRRRYCL